MITRILKWALGIVAVLAVAGFVAFLYFIPPFAQMAPDAFIQSTGAAPPTVEGITDPAERAIAERGRYLVLTADCSGCHSTPGPQGPEPGYYLAGGMKFVSNTHGGRVSRNLTPDKETGLGARTPDDVKRVLRSGVFPDGRPIPHMSMPWPFFSNWSDEDLHAVIAYLRHIKPVHHVIPPAEPGRADALVPGTIEVVSGTDAGKK